MNSPSAAIPFEYRQPVWGQIDRALRNSLRAAAVFGVLLLVTVYVVPRPADHELLLDEVPERFARLILEKPQAPAPAADKPGPLAQAETPEVEEPAPVKVPTPEARPKPRTRRRAEVAPVNPEAGRRGREIATTQVAQNLESVQGTLDKALENLSATLPASESGSSSTGTRRRRTRDVRSGRSSSELGSVGSVQTTDQMAVGGDGLQSNGISIAAIADLGGDGAGEGGSGGGSSEGGGAGQGGEFRSNASLLSVVRRYAAGIQFCYDNQLKKEPGLRGKLVVSLTVLANGAVSEAQVVQDNLGSSSVTDCVLAQIRTWKFPAIEHGVVSFKTPFVFTPPE